MGYQYNQYIRCCGWLFHMLWAIPREQKQQQTTFIYILYLCTVHWIFLEL